MKGYLGDGDLIVELMLHKKIPLETLLPSLSMMDSLRGINFKSESKISPDTKDAGNLISDF